jgi:hypothetical protein
MSSSISGFDIKTVLKNTMQRVRTSSTTSGESNASNGTEDRFSMINNTSFKRPSAVDFHLDAFAIRNEDNIRNPNLFSELYSMAYASAGECGFLFGMNALFKLRTQSIKGEIPFKKI